MSSSRVNPFANLDAAPQFDVKPKTSTRGVVPEQIEQLARENNFPSREGERGKSTQRKPRRHITGRNQQLNIKVTAQTIDRFYRLADERDVPLGQLLEEALNALEDSRRAMTQAIEPRSKIA